jgi:hypothetical protein
MPVRHVVYCGVQAVAVVPDKPSMLERMTRSVSVKHDFNSMPGSSLRNDALRRERHTATNSELRLQRTEDRVATEEIQLNGVADNKPERRTGGNRPLETIKSFVIKKYF